MNATMDPIESFIQSNRKFSISLLMNSHARLSILQMNKGGLTFEDILQSLYVQGQTMNTIELNSHAMLILGILVPALTTKGQIKLQMQREIVGNDSGFIKSILNLIYLKCGNVEYPFVEEFKMDAIAFLKYKQNLNRFNQFGGNLAGSFEGGWHDGSHGMIQRPMDGNSIMANGGQRKSAAVSKIHSVLVPDSDLPDDHKPSASRIEFEKSEPIVRLLAQVRKVGMDVLFPQSTHDKILACIFVAIRSSSTPAHRELIDMVMAVREADKITQLDHVSKTKVRGVLALLKHGELLITQGAEGEPVRLYLAPGINTFRDLRERHDVFLSRYMLEHHLFVPAILKSELVWHFEEETRARRLDALDQLVAQLHFFYKSYLAHVAETEETGAPPARAAHSEDATGLLLGPSTAGEDTSLCGGSRLSLGASSDMGSTARETSSDRSSYRSSDTGVRSSWSSASKEDWGFSRPQSLPVQGSSARDPLAEQRPKSIAGFTPHQHSSKVDRGYPFQGPPFQQSGGHGDNPSMPRNVANGGGGGMGYSLWGGQGFGSSDSADRSSGRLSLDLSAQQQQQQQQQHLSGDFGLFSDEAFRNAPPQLRQPAFPIDRNAAAYGAVDEPSYLSGYGGSVGGRPGSYRHAPPQVMGDFHHRHQPQQQGQGVGSHWTSASNQQQLGSHHMSAHTARTVGRDPQYPPSFAGQHSAGHFQPCNNGGNHHLRASSSTDSFDIAAAATMGRALGPGQVVLGGGNMRDLRDQLVDESTSSHRRLSAAAHVSADSSSSSSRSSGLDWEDFGVSALSARGGLGNLSSAPSTRTSVRVSSVQMLAAALDAEKASLAGGGSLSFGTTTNSF